MKLADGFYVPEDRVTDFWRMVDKSAGGAACWPWTGYAQRGSTGNFTINGLALPARRWAWALTYGDVPPEGAWVRLTCSPKGSYSTCVNPMHLEVVVPYMGRCINGHALTKENRRLEPSGRLRCLECRREAKRAQGRRRRAAH